MKYLLLLLLGFWPTLLLATETGEAHDVLAEMGIKVSSGAASGYVPDAVCAECHVDKAESFADMGMARSFYKPRPETAIEDFSATPFFHEPSQRYYEMDLRGEDYWFTRYGKTPAGDKIDVFSTKVDWILGSGNHSRIYLYQTPDGAMFQLPVSWYTQDGVWAMAPGYEFPDHKGVLRAISNRCMTCHNSYPAYPEDAGFAGQPQLFPQDMPEGINCQRCHGPGADHVERAYGGADSLEELQAAITNPGKLPREKLYSICYGCHMQPTASINGQLRLGRGEFSFRPGQHVHDFLMKMEIEDPAVPAPERFEINHHPYRMEQSACFTQTQGELGCLTCHDPHVKIKPEDRAAHYRAACLSCHETDDAGLPAMAEAGDRHPQIAQSDDCTACHMPKRRTQDVVEVWMTDHKITRTVAPEGDRLAPIPSEKVQVKRIFPADPDQDVPEAERRALTLMSVLEYTAYKTPAMSRKLHGILDSDKVDHFEPWLTLLNSYVAQKNFAAAARIADHTLSRAPENPGVITAAAITRFRTGHQQQAIAMLRELVKTQPGNIEPRLKLGNFLAVTGQVPEAMQHVKKVVELRPNHWQAWTLLAGLQRAMGAQEDAVAAYLKALDIRPESHGVRRATVKMLDSAGRKDEAKEHFEMLKR
ncbi:tetratricopeptide repeat protein [Roseovarius sp. A21]|uniref:Tetratricopeptide repeat protein n=1 Tax=Roseovarius bejariae TaxID=2576383 RepID=A0A844D1L4_9RHOB|nr:tetratricopeptide repeat protein [Roseovarius bejariae]